MWPNFKENIIWWSTLDRRSKKVSESFRNIEASKKKWMKNFEIFFFHLNFEYFNNQKYLERYFWTSVKVVPKKDIFGNIDQSTIWANLVTFILWLFSLFFCVFNPLLKKVIKNFHKQIKNDYVVSTIKLPLFE